MYVLASGAVRTIVVMLAVDSTWTRLTVRAEVGVVVVSAGACEGCCCGGVQPARCTGQSQAFANEAVSKQQRAAASGKSK